MESLCYVMQRPQVLKWLKDSIIPRTIALIFAPKSNIDSGCCMRAYKTDLSLLFYQNKNKNIIGHYTLFIFNLVGRFILLATN